MKIREFQKLIEEIYFDRDSARGIDRTFVWFVEEVGELATEIRKDKKDTQRLREEFADVFAWLTTLASLLQIDLEDAAKYYETGCPKCREIPCRCTNPFLREN